MGSEYTVVVVKEVEVEEKVKVAVEKEAADRRSLPAAAAVEALAGESVEDKISQVGVEAVKEMEGVADHMDSHILNTFHIQSAFSLLSSMQEIVIPKAERRNRGTSLLRGREKFCSLEETSRKVCGFLKNLTFSTNLQKARDFGI